jgi:hypothetical protein
VLTPSGTYLVEHRCDKTVSCRLVVSRLGACRP